MVVADAGGLPARVVAAGVGLIELEAEVAIPTGVEELHTKKKKKSKSPNTYIVRLSHGSVIVTKFTSTRRLLHCGTVIKYRQRLIVAVVHYC